MAFGPAVSVRGQTVRLKRTAMPPATKQKTEELVSKLILLLFYEMLFWHWFLLLPNFLQALVMLCFVGRNKCARRRVRSYYAEVVL